MSKELQVHPPLDIFGANVPNKGPLLKAFCFLITCICNDDIFCGASETKPHQMESYFEGPFPFKGEKD